MLEHSTLDTSIRDLEKEEEQLLDALNTIRLRRRAQAVSQGYTGDYSVQFGTFLQHEYTTLFGRLQSVTDMKKAAKARKAAANGPPPITPNSLGRVGVVLRYRLLNNSGASVFVNCVGKLMGIAATAANAYPLYESITLKKLVVYGPGIVATSAGSVDTSSYTISVRMDDGVVAPFGSERRYSDTPTTERGSRISARFQGTMNLPIDVAASATLSGQRLFYVEGPLGTIVDLHCTVQYNSSRFTAGPVLTGTGMTVGKTYFAYLDNTNSSASTTGTQLLLPIGQGAATTGWY